MSKARGTKPDKIPPANQPDEEANGQAVAAAAIADIGRGVEPHKDKVDQVLKELRERSSEIVIREQLRKATPDTLEGIASVLDEVCGLDGWQIKYGSFSDGVQCAISIFVAGKWVEKSGVGVPRTTTDNRRTLLREAVEEATKAAAVMFGIRRTASLVTGMTAGGNGKLGEKPTPPPKEAAKHERTKDEYIAEWKTKLNGCATPEDLNEALPALKAVPEAHKGAVWKFIQATVKEDRPDWSYDKDNKKYIGPDDEPVGEAVPF